MSKSRYVKTYVKTSLYNLMKIDWQDSIKIKPKLRTYIIFKTEFETEHYIKYHMSKRNRSLLAQFRLGILPINIEIGRYSNIPLDRRICNIIYVKQITLKMNIIF
jgi:hypothetical protein